MKKIIFLLLLYFSCGNLTSQQVNFANTHWNLNSLFLEQSISYSLTPNLDGIENDVEIYFLNDNKYKAIDRYFGVQINGNYHLYANRAIKLTFDNITVDPQKKGKSRYETEFYDQQSRSFFYQYYPEDSMVSLMGTPIVDLEFEQLLTDFLEDTKDENIVKARNENYFLQVFPAKNLKINGSIYVKMKVMYGIGFSKGIPMYGSKDYVLFKEIYTDNNGKIYEMINGQLKEIY